MSTCYALIKTGGITVSSISIILVVWYALKGRGRCGNIISKGFTRDLFFFDKGLVPIIIVASLFYIFQLNLMFDFEIGNEIALFKDYSYYSRISSYLRDFGFENRNLEYFLSDKGGVTIYHYFELWLAALLSDLFKVHTQYSLNLITYPLLFSTIYGGAVMLIRYFKERLNKKQSWFDYVFPLLFFTTSMLGMLFPSSSSLLAMDVWTSSILSMPKLAVIYIFLLVILLSVFEKDFFKLSINVCLLSVCYTPITPSLFFGVGLFYLFKFYRKEIDFSKLVFYLSPIILTSVLFGVLYSVYGGNDSVSPGVLSFIKHYSSLAAIKTFVNIFGKTMIQILITSFPFLLLSFLLRKHFRKIKDVFLMLVFLIFSGLFFYAFFNQMHDAVQLWANLYMPLVNTFSFFLVVFAVYLSNWNRVISTLGLLIIVANIYQHNPLRKSKEKYLDKISDSNLSLHEKARFVFIKQQADYIDYFSRFDQVYAGETLTLMRYFDPLIISSVSNHLINSNNQRINKFQRNTTFIRYISDLKIAGDFVNYKNAQLKFIKEKDINFILMYKNRPLPDHFHSEFSKVKVGKIDGYSIYKKLEDKNE